MRAQVTSCSRPGRTGDVHNGHPFRCGHDLDVPAEVVMPDHHRSTFAVGPAAFELWFRIGVPSMLTWEWLGRAGGERRAVQPGCDHGEDVDALMQVAVGD